MILENKNKQYNYYIVGFAVCCDSRSHEGLKLHYNLYKKRAFEMLFHRKL